VKAELGSVKEEIKAVRSEAGSFKEEIKNDFRHQVGILAEDFQHKLQLVAEGQQMLAEKIERMNNDIEGVDRKVDAGIAGLAGSIRQLDKKIDAVAADVAAHRADTEGHKRGYMVKEP
jgi:outer membrane murein-binding lipoprotein Lpp